MILSSLNGYARQIAIEEYINNNQEIVGTHPRQETEAKLAFVFDQNKQKNIEINDLTKGIKEIIVYLIAEQVFKFPKLFDANYKFTPFQKIYFQDIYLDTPTKLLQKNKISYRIRRRFHNSICLYVNILCDLTNIFVKFHRNEIQFKTENEFTNQNHFSRVYESRFELRKESHPFSQGIPLPMLNRKKLLQWAQTGVFSDFKIEPTIQLLKKIRESSSIQYLQLSNKQPILIKRRRAHLTFKSPFGSGPNPEQVFIISIDSFGSDQYLKEKVVEIEIEFERNTSTIIGELVQSKTIFKNSIKNSIAKTSFKIAKKSAKSVSFDHQLIFSAIKNFAESHFSQTAQQTKSKYARIASLKLPPKK